MWFIGVEVEQEMSAPPPKKNPGSAPAMGAIPNHSILHPLPHPPTPQAIRVNTKRETFLKRIFNQNVNF